MLKDAPVTTMLPVRDLQRAREFYEQRLGLQPGGARPDGKFLYLCGGTRLALFPKEEGTKAEHTAISFEVPDIAAAVQALEARGVHFVDFEMPGVSRVGHVCDLGAEKAAWFQDTEGNWLCIHEEVDARPWP